VKTRTTELIDETVEAHKAIYDKLGHIKDEQARVRAANGLMVVLDYHHVFTPDAKPTAPAPTTTATPPATAPTKERAPGTPYKPKSLDPRKRIPMTELMTMRFWTGAYDRVKLHFEHCPNCENDEIDAHSEAKGKDYQACFECRMFLNPDGTAATMGE
jgi:hypothetical protein